MDILEALKEKNAKQEAPKYMNPMHGWLVLALERAGVDRATIDEVSMEPVEKWEMWLDYFENKVSDK